MRGFTLTAWKLSDFKGAISGGDGSGRTDPWQDIDVVRPAPDVEELPTKTQDVDKASSPPDETAPTQVQSLKSVSRESDDGKDGAISAQDSPDGVFKEEDASLKATANALGGSGTETLGDSFVGTKAALSGSAEQVRLGVKDDDGFLEDAYFETGAMSVLSQDLVLDGETYPAGKTHIEAEFQLITTDTPPITFTIARLGTGTSNSGENLLVFTDAPIKPGQEFKFAAASDKAALPYETICFAADTLVATPAGMRLIGSLRPGDSVLTRDSGVRAVRWVGRRRFGAGDLVLRPNLVPVRIRAGALGPGRPARDLIVSPQHRMLIEGWHAQCMFGEAEVLAHAIGLVGAQGIARAGARRGVDYVHLLLDRHEVIWADGAWSETLLTGPVAQKVMARAAWEELQAIFPHLGEGAAAPARPILTAREGRVLIDARGEHRV